MRAQRNRDGGGTIVPGEVVKTPTLLRAKVALTLVAAMVMSVVSAAPSSAAPVRGQDYQIKGISRCVYVESTGRYVVYGKARTWVLKLPSSKWRDRKYQRYYQKVRIQIDRLTSAGWRKHEGRTWRWSSFYRTDLPTYSTSGVRGPVGTLLADRGFFTMKVVVRLKRDNPGLFDSTVWKYTKRSTRFECPDASGSLVGAGTSGGTEGGAI